MATRRALSVGVAQFEQHDRLDFAPGLVIELAAVLADLGYAVQKIPAERLDGQTLGLEVVSSLRTGNAEDLSIVHLVTHGEAGAGRATVYAIGTDGEKHGEADTGHWLATLQNETGPTTLFLLDLCSGGLSARLPWQAELEQPLRGWVVAGCEPGRAAFDGRFTRAVINVLRALRDGELDVDPSAEFAPIETVARAIRREVNRLATEEDSYAQQVTASRRDISADEQPPFFRNPAFRTDDRLRLRAVVDPGVLPFFDDLDEGLDARHFVERATGLGGLAGTGMVGCFTGRDRELKRISPWLNGFGEDTNLQVVTGSPGAGKSALLGVLVCAASPELREATEPIWEDVAQPPLPVHDLAAVHARQREPEAVVASIARQLGLSPNLGPGALVRALRERPVRPVLVVDALDEADEPVRLMTELLLPLVDPSSPGTPVRLLVGVRRYKDFAPLIDRATLVDLDEVQPRVLENDLFRYVTSLLRASHRHRVKGAVIGAFADAVAHVLAQPDPTGRRRWGPFLVAGLYTRHFVAAHAHTEPDADEAAELGRRVPDDLPGVLELDLALQRDQVWLRPVMTALAHARGAGMPMSVLTRVVPVFADASAPPTTAEIRSALTAGKFYLRQSLDAEQSRVYRLFHQGLVETLARDGRPGPVLDALLAPLGPPDARDWEAAEPYLLEHIAEHAEEAGRPEEVLFDPGLMLHPAATDRFADARTPAELAIAAARRGLPELARRAANLANHPPLDWQPRWTLGAPGSGAHGPGASVHAEPVDARAVAISADGSLVAAIGTGGLHLWTWPEDEPPGHVEFRQYITGDLVAISGDTVAAGHSSMLVRTRRNEPSFELSRNVAAVIGDPEGKGFVWVNPNGMITRFPSTVAARAVHDLDPHRRRPLWSVALNGGDLTLAAPEADGQLSIFRSGRPVARAVAPDVTVLAAGEYVAAGHADGRVGLTRDGDWSHGWALAEPVTALAFAGPGPTLLAGCVDGTVHVLSTTAGTKRTYQVSQNRIVSLAASGADRFVAVDERGDVHWTWHLQNSATPPEPRAVVTAVELLEPGTVAVGMADGSYSVDLDPTTGDATWLPALDSELVDFALTTVGGERAVLVATDTEHYLHTGAAPPVRLGWSDWAAARFEARQTEPVIRLGDSLAVVSHDAGILSMAVGATPAREFGRHVGCRVVHCATVEGRPTAFSGGGDGQVRTWDLLDGRQTGTLHLNQPVWMIGTVHGTHLLVAAGDELVCFVHVSANQVGHEITVEVLDVDMERERVSLSRKATQEDPWRQFARTHPVGQIVPGKVTKLVPFGAFVRVDEGIEGLVHISELAERHVEIPEQVVQVGNDVMVKVIDIDLERRRISLSLKQANEGFTADTEFDPTQYGLIAEYDSEGNYIYPEGFDPVGQEWLDGYERQREEWERQYAEARHRYERHMAQVGKAAEAEAALNANDKQKSAGTLASDELLADLRRKLSGGTLASDEQLAALRKKLSGR